MFSLPIGELKDNGKIDKISLSEEFSLPIGELKDDVS